MREIGSPVAAAVVLRPPRAPERRSGRLANAGLMVTTFNKRSLPVRKQRISKARPNGKNSPLLDVLHRRHLTKALNHRVIVHNNRGFEFSNSRNRFNQRCGQVETAAFPISGKILRATVNRAVGLDLAGTADADERC
jgi:hypothetical protein